MMKLTNSKAVFILLVVIFSFFVIALLAIFNLNDIKLFAIKSIYSFYCKTNEDIILLKQEIDIRIFTKQQFIVSNSKMEFDTKGLKKRFLLLFLNPKLNVVEARQDKKSIHFSKIWIFLFLKLDLSHHEKIDIEIKYRGKPNFELFYCKGGKITEEEIILSPKDLWYPLFPIIGRRDIKIMSTIDKNLEFFAADNVIKEGSHSKAFYQFYDNYGSLLLMAGRYKTYCKRFSDINICFTADAIDGAPFQEILDWSSIAYRLCESYFGKTDEKCVRIILNKYFTVDFFRLNPSVCSPNLIALPSLKTGFDKYAVAHEIAHLWWGLSVCFEPFQEGISWLIEGLPTYIESCLQEQFIDKRLRILSMNSFNESLASSNLSHLTQFEKSLASYRKGNYSFEIMKLLIGQEKTNLLLNKMYQSLKNKCIALEDIEKIICENIDSTNYEKIKEWITTEKVLNLQIELIDSNDFMIKNIGNFKIDGPVEILYIYNNDSCDLVTEPMIDNECIRKLPVNVKQVYVDPFCRWPDYDRRNNFLYKDIMNTKEIFDLYHNSKFH